MIRPAEDTALRLARRALAAARSLPHARAYAVLARAQDLPADPLAHHAAEPRGARSLLWWQSAWMLASGAAEAVSADGPGRALHLAEAAARLRTCTVVESCSEGCPPVPVLQLALGSEDRAPGPSHWGRALPGARLLLPQRLYWRRRSGTGWRIDAVAVHADDDVDAIVAGLQAPVAAPTLEAPAPWPELDAGDFRKLVGDTAALIGNGAFRKVVLARAEDHRLPRAPDPAEVLAGLHRSADEWTYVYAHDLPDGASFLGATPELLFHLKDDHIRTVALAGSRPRSDRPEQDQMLGEELMASTKERKEHQLVVEHLTHQLRPRCDSLTVPGTPSLRRLDRLQHLETAIAGRVHRADPFDLIDALHPTPAVAGLPVEAAGDYIRRVEGLHRGLYTGTIGYCSADAARMLVPLRGGILRGEYARLFAGAGIVETSDPDAEYRETDLKLGPMRRALGIET